MKHGFPALLPVLFLALCAAASAAEGPQVFAIHGARIMRVSGPPIESGTVVVRDGIIEAVGPNITAPADAWVIEGKGLTVYPGLVDALSTWGVPGLAPPAAVAGGRRGAGSPGPVPFPTAPQPVINGPEDRPSNTSYLKIADQLVATDATITTARDAGFTTAVTFPNTNIFAGQGAMFSLAGERPGQMVVVPSAGLYLTMRSTSFATYPGSLMGVIAYIRQIYLDADHYKAANAIYAKHPQGLMRPAYDRTLEAVINSPRALLPARRMVEIDRMLRFAQEVKINAVLYGGDEAWRSVELLQKAKVPILVSLKWPERARDADPALNDPLHELEMRDKAPSAPAALAKGGVKFAFYSDGLATPKEVVRAVKRAIDAGLAPADAVRAMTLSPAEIYGVADRLGSIDKGKIANLLVTEGDLFQDKTKVKYVFVDGMKYEPVPEVVPAHGTTEKTQ